MAGWVIKYYSNPKDTTLINFLLFLFFGFFPLSSFFSSISNMITTSMNPLAEDYKLINSQLPSDTTSNLLMNHGGTTTALYNNNNNNGIIVDNSSVVVPGKNQ